MTTKNLDTKNQPINKLETIKNTIVKDNIKTINDMIRRYGIGYYEELLYIIHIVNNKPLIDTVFDCMYDMFKKLLLIIDNYCETKGIRKFEKYKLFFNAKNDIDGESKQMTTIEKINDYIGYMEEKKDLGKISTLIHTFLFGVETPENFKFFIDMFLNNSSTNINNHHQKHIKMLAEQMYGIPFKIITKNPSNIFMTPVYTTCLINKNMRHYKNIIDTNCQAIQNNQNNKNDEKILFSTQDFEKQQRMIPVGDGGITGRVSSTNNKDNNHIKLAVDNWKISTAGYSGATIGRIMFLNTLSDIDGCSYLKKKACIIISLIYTLAPQHHSIHVILSTCNILFLPDMKDVIQPIFQYNPSDKLLEKLNELISNIEPSFIIS